MICKNPSNRIGVPINGLVISFFDVCFFILLLVSLARANLKTFPHISTLEFFTNIH